MSKVDWSLAPSATHLTDVPGDFYRPVFWRVVDGVALEAWSVDRDYTKVSDHYTYGPEGCLSYSYYEAIARPVVKPWSGPEDGLPPVGTVCDWHPSVHGWIEVTILGRHGEDTWYHAKGESRTETCRNMTFFRAIKTPAQLAPDKRETAIRELMDIAQVDCRVTAARLVDAGFKREVV